MTTNDPQDTPPPAWVPRELRDPGDMRALAHPTRLSILEVLTVRGPLTATQASVLVGESPSSCSFHLRTLARHGFVEEAGDKQGRQRPWRVVNVGSRLRSVQAEPEASIAADALTALFVERQLTRFYAWQERRRSAEPKWQEAAANTQHISWLTAEELEEIGDAVREVMGRHVDRLADPAARPEGSRLVEMLYYSYPVEIPGP